MKASSLARQKEIIVVGIMSGTSLDGVDFVWTRITKRSSGLQVRYIDMKSVSFPKALRARLQAAAQQEFKVDALAELHFDLGRFYARTLRKVTKKKFDLIGLHGQTVYHCGGAATLQIGEPSFLSAEFQVPVVANFRVADLAAGGQGAPLAPLFHQVAFAGRDGDIAAHNLGGISNLTLFRRGQIQRAFDTGPANMPLDSAVQIFTKGIKSFDAGGRWAAQGNIDSNFVALVLSHPFFKKKAPKSCGREEFGVKWLTPLMKSSNLEAADLLASLTEAIAISIARAYQKLSPFVPNEIILCGGGSKNGYLHERIQAHLPSTKVVTSEQKGWPSQAIEGAAFALLAAARLWEIPVDTRSSTGAKRPVCLGQITDL